MYLCSGFSEVLGSWRYCHITTKFDWNMNEFTALRNYVINDIYSMLNNQKHVGCMVSINLNFDIRDTRYLRLIATYDRRDSVEEIKVECVALDSGIIYNDNLEDLPISALTEIYPDVARYCA